MFKSVGFVISLYAITQLLGGAFNSFEKAAIATFDTIEAAAIISQEQLQKAKQ